MQTTSWFTRGNDRVFLCNRLFAAQSNRRFLESSPSKANAGTAIEHVQAPLSIEREQLEEPPVKDVPSQLKGSVEDEALSVILLAQLKAGRNGYKTDIEFRNKSVKSLDLIFDCGSLISNDRFAPNPGACLAVESMLLKKNKRESVSITLSRDFFDTADNVLTVRYRQDTITKDLEIKLEASE